MLSQNEYNVTKQTNRELYTKINLLNYQFQIVSELSGVVIGNPSFTNNSDSDIRRTCNISLIPIDSSFDIAYGNKIWLDKYVQIYIGIKDTHTKEIVYTNMGIYIINNPTQTYNATTNNITIQGSDLMAKLTGLRGGNLEGIAHIIPQDSNVRQTIIALLELSNIHKYIVEECPYLVPNEIKVEGGSSVYNLLKQLRDICPNYQIYFDVDGVFHYEKIPSGDNEPIMVTNDIWNKTLIGYTVNTDFDNIKNVIEVYGKTHDISYFSEAIIEGNIYKLTIEGLTAETIYNNMEIGFNAPTPIANPYLQINDLPYAPLLNTDGSFATLKQDTNIYYVAKYIKDSNYYLYLGEITPVGIAKEDNPQSPFYINGTMGISRLVLTGGEYDSIYSDELAQIRAEWELYTRCRLQDSITLTCVPIYWLDTNWVITITLPNKNGNIKENERYIVKSINTSYGESQTQTITCMKYYSYYNE